MSQSRNRVCAAVAVMGSIAFAVGIGRNWKWQTPSGADAFIHQSSRSLRSSPVPPDGGSRLAEGDGGQRTDFDEAEAVSNVSGFPALDTGKAAAALAPAEVTERALADFREWSSNYLQASVAERIRLETQGMRLSQRRRSALKELIQRDPKTALQWGVAAAVRRELPALIQVLLEEPVSAKGDLFVAGALPRPGHENGFQPVQRNAVIDGRIYRAYTFGRRLNELSRRHISLHGFAIDDVLALQDSPVRVLASSEAPTPDKVNVTSACPISGKTFAERDGAAGDDTLWVESGDTVYRVCGSTHAEVLAGQVKREEELLSPALTDPLRNLGPKSVLVMIVDFPDRPGGNTTESNAMHVLETVNGLFQANSFQRMSLETIQVTPVLRMPRSSSEYVAMGSPVQLLFDARDAAQTAGFAPADFDFHLVSFTYIGFPWSGLGFIGERGAFAQDWFLSHVVVAHELGHNLGNWHAGSWETADDSIIGPGTHIEYGNPFDLMGGSLSGHFNANFKSLLGWLPAENVLTVTNSGTYRLHAMDSGDTRDPAKWYAIRIRGGVPQNGVPTDYWIDFRQQYANNAWARNGALIKWGSDYAGEFSSHLLDTTPGTPDRFRDAPLIVGRTFSDRQRGVHVSPVARAGFGSEAHLDLQITFDNPANQAPTLALESNGSQLSPGAVAAFTAIASDPDGDSLSYHWDFGDGTIVESNLNQPMASKSWTAENEYLVRCVVSDRKGAEASASMIVRVGSPSSHRISGRAEAFGSSVSGVRVHNGLSGSDYRAAFTDASGAFTLVGLSEGHYHLGAAKPGFVFAPAFVNPVTVAAQNLSNLLIRAAPPGMPLIAGFAPEMGGVGSTVNLQGFNFASVSAVNVGDLPAPHTLISPTELWLTIPQGAVTGPIRVVNALGSDTSVDVFTVTSSPPAIVAHPQTQTVLMGATVTFSVESLGSGPLFFQWRKEGDAIPEGTNATLTLVNVHTNQAGLYDVLLGNPAGVVTSEVALLTVLYVPTLAEALDTTNLVWTASPEYPWTTLAGLNHDGEDAALSGSLSSVTDESWLETTLVGPVELNFWWRRAAGSRFLCTRASPLSSQTLIDYDGARTNWQQAALYIPEGTNVVRWTCRAGATFDHPRLWLDEVRVKPIDDTAPRILEPPQSQIANAGDIVRFRVRAAGYQPLYYQWFKVASPGLFTATNETLTLIGVGTGDAGSYGVYIYNLLGGVFSPTASLTVNAAAPSGFHITRVEGAVVLTWEDPQQWFLEEAESLEGPWRPTQGAGGGSHSTPADGHQKFFRLRRY